MKEIEDSLKKVSIEEWLKKTEDGFKALLYIEPQGVSMKPLIRLKKGDYVKVKRYDREPKIGDMVLFIRSDGVYTFHRLWRKLEKQDGVWYQTIGDGCLKADAPVPKENLLGYAIILGRAKRKTREYNVDCTSARLFGRIWWCLWPLRWLKAKLRLLCSKIYHKIFG